ncbi:MAG: MopE-related protein [Polyangiaceae bacterium]
MGCPSAKGSGTGATSAGGGGAGGNGGSTAGAGGNTAGAGGATCVPETEICDGKDNDCDGQIDNVAAAPSGCACNDGATQDCYTGPDGTSGKGACKAGTQTCANGAWGECAGQVVPAKEECNLIDDDCNDAVDDMGTTMCGVGACTAVVDKCVNGQAQQCIPNMPSVEVCDGIDNNCNQLIDETDPMLDANCDSGQLGVCAPGKMKCIAAALTCQPFVTATTETCNGKDDDCNGAVDDNIAGTGSACSTGALGVCAAGTLSCQDAGGGNYTIDCFQDVAASAETCDGLDNDCDGTVDNGDPGGGGACDTGLLGECAAGTLHCQNGAITCVQNKMPSTETCDAKDNNCDGMVDNGNPGGGQACGCGGAGVTACQNGAIVCNGGPTTYFFEDFKDNSKGWTVGQNWQIGPAIAGCAGCTGNPDPGVDHTATADNGIAGVVLGGPAPTVVAAGQFYYLTSPTINTAGAAGSVYLQFWRWLNSDYDPFMHNVIQVSTDNGTTWVTLPYGATGGCCGVQDSAWTNHGLPNPPVNPPTSAAQYPTQFDLTAYKSATMKIRFGYDVASSGVYTIGSWNLDDILIASAICP